MCSRSAAHVSEFFREEVLHMSHVDGWFLLSFSGFFCEAYIGLVRSLPLSHLGDEPKIVSLRKYVFQNGGADVICSA